MENLNFDQFFQYIKPIGKGAFAKVVEAVDLSTQQSVAVKIINKQNVSEQQIHKLRKEAEILESLNHPNIVKFKRIIETETKIFIVMELMQESLKSCINKRVQQNIGFTEEEVRLIMISILKAVQYMHQKGVIHRDLKPENILIGDKKQIGEVKIADFGLSAKFEFSSYRITNGRCGTMIFMAPEQANNQNYSSAVDL